MRSAILLLSISALGFAGTWPGYLVDAKCYAAEERNVSPMDTMHHADSDMNYEIRYCSPNLKTRNFAVVQQDWSSLKLDPAGNSKAAELVRKAGKQRLHFLRVDVNGELDEGGISVNSISPEADSAAPAGDQRLR